MCARPSGSAPQSNIIKDVSGHKWKKTCYSWPAAQGKTKTSCDSHTQIQVKHLQLQSKTEAVVFSALKDVYLLRAQKENSPLLPKLRRSDTVLLNPGTLLSLCWHTDPEGSCQFALSGNHGAIHHCLTHMRLGRGPQRCRRLTLRLKGGH